jgi:hypothetical protein
MLYAPSGSNRNKPASHIGFDVLTAVVMKIAIFWDIAPV